MGFYKTERENKCRSFFITTVWHPLPWIFLSEEAYEVWPVSSIRSKLANLLDSGCLDSSSSSLFWHTVSRNTRIVDCRLAPAVLSYLSGLINKLVQTRTLPCVSTLRVPRLNDIPPSPSLVLNIFPPLLDPLHLVPLLLAVAFLISCRSRD